jgi:hypothetical protein
MFEVKSKTRRRSWLAPTSHRSSQYKGQERWEKTCERSTSLSLRGYPVHFIRARCTVWTRYNHNSASRVSVARSHDSNDHPLASLCFQSSNLAIVSLSHSSISLCIRKVMMADSKGNHKGIFALPNEVSRDLSHSTPANARTD